MPSSLRPRSSTAPRSLKSPAKPVRSTPDPFAAPLTVFENEILFLLGGKSLPAGALKTELRAYGETDLSEWRHLDVSLPSALAGLEERGWLRCSGEKYRLTPQARAFVGVAEVE